MAFTFRGNLSIYILARDGHGQQLLLLLSIPN